MNDFFYQRLLAAVVMLAGISACGTTGSGRGADLPLSAEPLTGKFIWHDLITDDVAAVRGFYGGLFGWKFEETKHPNGSDYTLISAGGHFIGGIVQLDDPPGIEYSRWLGYLSVPDVDSAVKTTEAAGGLAVAGPLDVPSIGRAAAIQDPQGAVVGLLHSKIGDPDDSVTPVAGHIVWNELLAADDIAASGFYQSITGARSRTIQRRGGEYIMLRAQGRDRAGIMRRPLDDVEPLWLTHFAVTDPAAAALRVADLGGTVLIPPSADLRDGTMAVVADPSGSILALRQWPE